MSDHPDVAARNRRDDGLPVLAEDFALRAPRAIESRHGRSLAPCPGIAGFRSIRTSSLVAAPVS